MRIASVVLATFLLSSPAMAEIASPDHVAHEFYAWLLSQPEAGSGLPASNDMVRLAEFLSPALQELLGNAIAMEKRCVENTLPGEKPHIIEGNIFVGNYEGATEVIVGQARHEGKNAYVESRLFSIDVRFPKSHQNRVLAWTDQLVISPEGGKWVISNITFASGHKLTGLLEEYLNNAALWCKEPKTNAQRQRAG